MIKKFLHTSDWHIGRRLKDFERYDEFKKFFEWLENIIKSENIEALLVSGDIFDNTTPSTQAQEIYYSFLAKISKSNCRHIIIISGNHDSPTFLDAPSELLKLFKIHIIGQACENTDDEVITLYDENNNPEMIVCAVPYLRERDVRVLKAGDSLNDIEENLIEGIKEHYEKVFERAKILVGDSNIPVIAMGHLFAHGGKINFDDGVRALYVGTSIEVSADIFPEFLTYTALGHLHSEQKIKRENIRYSGSPLAMSFGESRKNKFVNIIELEGKNIIDIKNIPVPIFQRLERIEGNLDEISAKIQELSAQNESIWLEISYTGLTPLSAVPLLDLKGKLEILSIKDNRRQKKIETEEVPINIENIKPLEMLEMCFNEHEITEEQRQIFIPMYKEILLNENIEY